jgi:hypothetical protein
MLSHKTEALGAVLAKQAREQVADLDAGRAKSEKAISAFATLAERLDALAAERAKPWWRWLRGAG